MRSLAPAAGRGVVAAGSEGTAGRARVRAVRAWWRTVHPPPGVLKRLEPVYYTAIAAIVVGPFVYGTASSALADVFTPRVAATWAPSLALVAVLAVTRWGAVQGPVVFSVADVVHLLGAPLPRAQLITRRLVRGLAWGAAGGGVAAAIAIVGIAGHGRGIAVERGVGFAVAAMLLGVLGVAGAALVQGSRGWDRVTRRANWPVLAAAAGLVFVSSCGPAGRHVVLWSGPWGWAVQPLVAGGTAWRWAVALLALVTVAAVSRALAGRGHGSTERQMRRAEARDGAKAAMYSFNARYVGRSLRDVNAAPSTGAVTRLRMPRSPRLAIVWRDAVATLATPQRLAEALALATAGSVICLIAAPHPAAVAGGALAVFAGASRLLEPLRAEIDKPSRARVLLRLPMGRILADHAIVPGLVVSSAAAIGAVGCVATGTLPPHGAAAALLVVAAAPAVTLCAALSSRRGGQLPASVMALTFGDTTGSSAVLVLGWIVAWPVLGVVLTTATVSLVAARGSPALAQAVVLLTLATAGLVAALRSTRFAP